MEIEHLSVHYNAQLDRVLKRIDPEEYGYEPENYVKNRRFGPYKLTKSNKQLLKRYYRQMINQGLSPSRINLVLGVLGRLLEMLRKDFEKSTVKDIMGSETKEGLLTKIQEMPISAITKSDYLKKLKMLDKFTNGGEEPSERTKKLKTGIGKKHYKLPEQLLTPEEAKQLYEATENQRDRALIYLLWESGARVGEIINLKINSIQFNKGEAKISLKGKMGARQILLLESTSDIREYLKLRKDARVEEPLFTIGHGSTKGEYLKQGTIRNAIERAKANTNKEKNLSLSVQAFKSKLPSCSRIK